MEVKIYRKDMKTGEIKEITREEALWRLRAVYSNTEQVLKETNRNHHASTGWAEYWIEEASQ